MLIYERYFVNLTIFFTYAKNIIEFLLYIVYLKNLKKLNYVI